MNAHQMVLIIALNCALIPTVDINVDVVKDTVEHPIVLMLMNARRTAISAIITAPIPKGVTTVLVTMAGHWTLIITLVYLHLHAVQIVCKVIFVLEFIAAVAMDIIMKALNAMSVSLIVMGTSAIGPAAAVEMVAAAIHQLDVSVLKDGLVLIAVQRSMSILLSFQQAL
jgi:hypothetical protein